MLNSSADSIENMIQGFGAHSLSSLNKARLMNRVDTKFVVPVTQVEGLLSQLQGCYTALEIEGERTFKYSNVYHDTRDYQCYNMHHNKHLNRHKIRLRHYLNSGDRFLEVKFKNNKKRTYKHRIQLPNEDSLNTESCIAFISECGVRFANALVPTLRNEYTRIALACELRGERLTIDYDLKNKPLLLPGESVQLPNIAVLELKQQRLNRRSPFFDMARKYGVRSGRFSKYCLGVALTDGFGVSRKTKLKRNRFKSTLLKLEKLAV